MWGTSKWSSSRPKSTGPRRIIIPTLTPILTSLSKVFCNLLLRLCLPNAYGVFTLHSDSKISKSLKLNYSPHPRQAEEEKDLAWFKVRDVKKQLQKVTHSPKYPVRKSNLKFPMQIGP